MAAHSNFVLSSNTLAFIPDSWSYNVIDASFPLGHFIKSTKKLIYLLEKGRIIYFYSNNSKFDAERFFPFSYYLYVLLCTSHGIDYSG